MLKQQLLTIATIALLLSGCGTSPPTRFYTLSAEAIASSPRTDAADKVVIGIGPIEVAPYLERNQIVTRSGPTRLSVKEFDRWAAPIENNIADVLAINLARLLPDTRPIVRPWPDAAAEYTVLVKFLRFDADTEGKVQILASWGIQRRSTQSMPLIRDTVIDMPSTGGDYIAITQNMSKALALLSKKIADELQQLVAR